MYACSWQLWPLKMKGLLLVPYVRGPWLLCCTAISCYSRIFNSFHKKPPVSAERVNSSKTETSFAVFRKELYISKFPYYSSVLSCPLFNILLMTSQWYTVHSFTVQSLILYINDWQSLWWTVCFVISVLSIPTAVLFLSLSLGRKWKIKPTTEWWADFRLK